MKSAQVPASRNQRALTYAVIIALVAGFFFLRQFLTLIMTATIVAFLFTPVYNWLRRKLKSEGRAAALTLIITILAIVLPMLFIVAITVNQASTMVSDATNFVSSQSYSGAPEEILQWINESMSNITGREITITQEQVWDQLAKYASSIASFVLDTITSWIGSIGSIITSVILYMYVLTAVLVHREKLISLFKRLNPLGEDVSQLYLDRAEGMTKAMVRGQFIIAVIQGFTSASILALTGMPYFAFFALLLSFMSLIPLGAGILTIPIGIARILMGDIWQGSAVILGHLLIITNIDNFLKPVLVPKSVKLQPALLLLAVFAGMGMFGFLGIFVGPVIMILIITTLDVYIRTADMPESRGKPAAAAENK